MSIIYVVLGVFLIIGGIRFYTSLKRKEASEIDRIQIQLICSSIIIVFAGILLILMGLGIFENRF